jgi:pilus assembly protein CpaB
MEGDIMRRGLLRTLFRNRVTQIALGLLILAGLTYPFTRQQIEPAQAPVEVFVVTASATIPPRTVITSNMVEMKHIEPGAVSKIPPGALRDASEAVNSVTAEMIPAGETITQSRLLGSLKDIGLTALIPIGKRAMILNLHQKPQVMNLLHPGDRIDVLATFENELTRTIVEDVEVMSVIAPPEAEAQPAANSANPPPPRDPLVVVAVTPPEAEVIALSSDAKLDFVMHPKDSAEIPRNSEGTLKKVVTRKLVKSREPKPSPPSTRIEQPPMTYHPTPPVLSPPTQIIVKPVTPPPPTNTVEVIAGGQRKVIEVPAKPE